jgi:mannose/fructose-specific phosphotransferase system component IIA
MVSAVIVTHGNLAEEFLATAKEIFGDVSGCYAVSNTRKSPQVLRDELDAILRAGGPDDRYLFFVDFFGGSCCHTCVVVEKDHDNVQLITGANLPMLLAFLYKRDDVPFDRLPGELIARGKDSIRLIKAEDM